MNFVVIDLSNGDNLLLPHSSLERIAQYWIDYIASKKELIIEVKQLNGAKAFIHIGTIIKIEEVTDGSRSFELGFNKQMVEEHQDSEEKPPWL